MKAVVWHDQKDMRIETMPDPQIQESTDAIIRVTSTAICGSDLHLYEPLSPFMHQGDIVGHEAMGIVEEVGNDVTHIRAGDRVVIPFNISCGHCWMCTRELYSQCETTQTTSHGTGAALFGYSELYGQIPGGQAQYLRVPQAQFGPIPVPTDGPDEQYLFLSDVLPTAWQAVAYADVKDGDTVAVMGLGPIGQMAGRIAQHQGAGRVIGIDPVAERRAMAMRHGIETLDVTGDVDEMAQALIGMVNDRGPDSIIDAVGMEAHGSPGAEGAQKAAGILPDALAKPFMDKVGMDRLAALHTSFKGVRRGGTVSISGVYGGEKDPMPMMEMFDRQIQVRMGQANVKKWIPDLMPLVLDTSDPLGVLDLTTHRIPLERAPDAYATFQEKEDGCIKVVLDPWKEPTS